MRRTPAGDVSEEEMKEESDKSHKEESTLPAARTSVSASVARPRAATFLLIPQTLTV
jgi:hypothetical protein